MAGDNGKVEVVEDKIWEQIKRQVLDVKYGTVLITIHDGKIVQLETSKKVRF
ncbi:MULTISPECIES: YezD family protein [unclassified Butyrivibrio]|uniref:YezD family protein n=1 Tax=unclassified Butyrivibrio TaxID=2639466 RepID=UPI0004174572|nr:MULTISPECIES: YezD family protein [unclassified Butyrivibrio]